MLKNLIIALFLIGIVDVPTDAQKLVPNQYEMEMLAPELLSTHHGIREIFEDKNGYLWFTSYKGLNCFDGQNFVTYNNAGNEDEMIITEEGEGFLSIVSADSVHFWVSERNTWDLILFNVETRKQIRRIKRKKRIIQESMSAADGEVFTVFSTEDDPFIKIQKIGLEDGPIISTKIKKIHGVYTYYKGYHWIESLEQGIVQVDLKGNTVRVIKRRTIEMIHSSKEALYFGRWDASIPYSINHPLDSLSPFFQVPDRFNQNPHCFFKIDDKIWCSDYFRGVYLYNPEQNTFQDYGIVMNSLASEKAPSTMKMRFSFIKKMKDNQIFISGYNYIYVLKPKSLGDIHFKEEINSGNDITSMRALVEDEVGNIYATYYTGLSVKEKGSNRFVEFRNMNHVPKQNPAAYDLTLKDDLLFWNHTAFNLKDGEFKHYHFDGFGSHTTHLLEADTMWFAFWNINLIGKLVIPTDSFQIIGKRFFNLDMQFSDFQLNHKKNGFYLATNLNGIICFDRNANWVDTLSVKDLSLNNNNSFVNSYVYEMYRDQDSLWYGTPKGLGLIDINTKKSRIFECPIIYKDGLSTLREVFTILPDKYGNFYLGTSHGLLYFNPTTKEFYQLAKDHPFYLKEFNRNSTLKASNGKYYMGTVNGLYSFYPEELTFFPISNTASFPFINHINIKNRNSDNSRNLYSGLNKKDNQIALKPNDYNLNIHFSSSNYEQAVYYSYRIREFGEEWNKATTNPYVEIYSLPPGKFTLDIQSTLDPKFASEEFVTFNISKPRIWYQRWWVIALFVLAIAGIGASILRNRFQQKLKRQKEMAKLRTKISSDLHDDVGSILSGLALQSEMMTYDSNEKQKESLNEMTEMSRIAMDKMRDTVWAIDSRKDKYIDLIQRMQVFAERSLGKKEIDYTFHFDGINKEADINPERRQNIYLIFKEAVTNILKHADADHVNISLIKKGQTTKLIIHDNGKGSVDLDAIKNSSGLGTSNIIMRAKRIGGKATFRNVDGFEVEVVI